MARWAHEPPAAGYLPDHEEALAANRDIQQTYERSGFGPAMAKFINIVMHHGPIPDDFADQPADPAMFGLPTEDDGSRDDIMLGNIAARAQYQFDLDALRSASTRIVLAVGAESEGELAHRGGVAVAERLDMKPVIFPAAMQASSAANTVRPAPRALRCKIARGPRRGLNSLPTKGGGPVTIS